MKPALIMLSGSSLLLGPYLPIFAQTPTPAIAPAGPCKTKFTDPVPRNPGGWVTSDDYPSSALRASEEGHVKVRIFVGVDGRVENVEVIESEVGAVLQEQTKTLLKRRARFTPATHKCVPVRGVFTTTVSWAAPD